MGRRGGGEREERERERSQRDRVWCGCLKPQSTAIGTHFFQQGHLLIFSKVVPSTRYQPFKYDTNYFMIYLKWTLCIFTVVVI